MAISQGICLNLAKVTLKAGNERNGLLTPSQLQNITIQITFLSSHETSQCHKYTSIVINNRKSIHTYDYKTVELTGEIYRR